MTFECRPMREDERDQFRSITAQSFLIAPERVAMHAATPLDEAWVALRDGRIQAFLRAERMGQRFGGRSVPTAVISAVQTAPEARGHGVARRLLETVLGELTGSGVVVSVLYPTTVRPYRALGYEFGGAFVTYRLPLHAIPRTESPLAVDPWDGSNIAEIQECYRRYVGDANGPLERSDRWWERRILAEWSGRPRYRYLVRRNGAVTGYLVYSNDPNPGDLDYSYSLACHDFVWLDRESAATLLGLARSFIGVGIDLRWHGPVAEPLFGLIDAEEIRTEESCHWMVRLLDPGAALEARGYLPSLTTSVEFAVRDGAGRRALRLEVAGGAGTVSWIGHAEAEIDASTLSAIWTGWLSPADAVRAGGLRGANRDQVERLATIFAGRTPFLLDKF